MRSFVFIALGLFALSIVAWAIRPPDSINGRTPLIWVSDDAPGRRLTIELFNEEHPTLDLRLDPDNGGMEKIIVQSLAGVGPDLFDCYNTSELGEYVRAGIAWDITDQLKAAGVDIKRDTWPLMWNHCIFEGRVYGFPANSSADAIWFNKDIFIADKISFPVHLTWPSLISLAERLTTRDATGHITCYGLAMEDYQWDLMVRLFGGHVFSPDGTRCMLDSPAAIAAVQMIHDLIYKYHVCASPNEEGSAVQSGGWGSYSMKAMEGGHAAMAIGGRWWLMNLRKVPTLRLGACQLPIMPGGVLQGEGKSTLINRHSPHRQQAFEFIRFMAGVKYNHLINQDADAMGGVVKDATDADLRNPQFPNEDFNAVFRDAMTGSQDAQPSPFVDASEVSRIINKQMDLVRRDAKPAADAMKTATRQIDEEMQRELRRDPALQRRYDKLLAGSKR